MAARSPSWCNGRHQWRITTNLLMAIPRPDGGTPILIIRACQRCPLAESMHVLQFPAKVRLRAYEWWSSEEVRAGWEENKLLYDKFTEAKSYT